MVGLLEVGVVTGGVAIGLGPIAVVVVAQYVGIRHFAFNVVMGLTGNLPFGFTVGIGNVPQSQYVFDFLAFCVVGNVLIKFVVYVGIQYCQNLGVGYYRKGVVVVFGFFIFDPVAIPLAPQYRSVVVTDVIPGNGRNKTEIVIQPPVGI